MVTFKEIVRQKEARASKRNSEEAPDLSAIKGGRQTVADHTTLGNLLSELSTIDPDFNINILQGLETLAKYHADFSYAVDNVKQLGNTNWQVYFDDSVPDKLQNEMLLRIKSKAKNWYAYSGGLTAMIGDLLAQTAIYGALSAENVVLEDLSGVKKTILVSPANIRFKYDTDKDEYTPYQILKNTVGLHVDNNMVELNTTTYKYIALGRYSEKPYGVPPFLSSLENIAIGRDMAENLKYVVKKLGTLGFLEVLVNGPKQLPNERAEDYYNRTQDYLNKVIPEIDKGLARGFVAGYKDVHEFNMHNLTSNVQGAKDLADMNDVKTMAGLKQDPLMFGRNFSTTETLGRVILAKMTTQVASYQKIVASYLESVFLTDLQLAGYNITTLDVIFEPPMVGDKLREEQTTQTKLANLDTLLNKGIIDIYQYAQEAGYEQPADPEKHLQLVPNLNDNEEGGGEQPDEKDKAKNKPKKKKNEDKEDTSDTGDATDPKTTESNERLIRELCMGSELIFPYGDEKDKCCEHHHKDSFAKGKDIDYFVEQYFSASNRNYGKAVSKVVAEITKALSKLGEAVTYEQVYDTVLYHLYTNWQEAFKAPQSKIISKFVEVAYNFFRKDKSIFGEIDKETKLPKATFDMVDIRAMEYFKNSDDLYLGKFITDPSTRKKIATYIKEKYLNNELPIGNSREAIKDFQNEFTTVLQGEDWKIRRVVDTTVNKLRNTAAVKYMEQALVEEFKIVGVNDNLQCNYCHNLQDKRFSITQAVKQVEQFVVSDPAYVPLDSPFITSVFKNAEDMKDLTGEELQAKGIHYPPFHCGCRDTVVAILN